jgi:hypothetical protein
MHDAVFGDLTLLQIEIQLGWHFELTFGHMWTV